MRTMVRKWPIVVMALVALVALALALFDSNWLRGPVSRFVSHRLDRPFAINGDLRVSWSLKPLITMDGVTLGNASWSDEPMMASADRIAFRIDLLSLLSSRTFLPELSVSAPRLLLERNREGLANWQFGARPGSGGSLPAVGHLGIDDGSLRYRDPVAKTDLAMRVASAPAGEAGGEDAIEMRGKGSLRGEAFTLEGRGASPVELEHKDRPYHLDVKARAGATAAQYRGTLVPSRLDALDGELSLQGKDLSQLYPLVPVPLPWTPAYSLSGRLRHDGSLWSFKSFKGKVGNSDLAGDVSVDRRGERPLVTGEVLSRSLDYQDLGGVVGLPPLQETAGKRTPAQNVEVAKRARTERVLPSKPYELERLRAADVSVHFKGASVKASNLPLDNLDTRIELRDGVLKLLPLDFGLAGGHVVSNLVLDARTATPKVEVTATIRNVDLGRLMPKLKPPRGDAGKVGGRAHLAGSGRSVAEWLGSSNGDLALISTGGQASELAIVLSNLDLARAAALLLRGDDTSPIHCGVATFSAKQGQLTVQSIVVDTSAERIVGQGSVDLRNERYDLRLEAKSKRLSLLALRGPIVIDGSLGAPRVGPAIGPLAARVGAAVALGAALTPVAALLPLIDPGGAPDADCGALVTEAQAGTRPSAVAKR